MAKAKRIVARVSRTAPLDVEPIVILDRSVVNLAMLQQLLGQTAESAKKWVGKHGIPALKGRTWLFSGRSVRLAVEKCLERQQPKTQ